MESLIKSICDLDEQIAKAKDGAYRDELYAQMMELIGRLPKKGE